MKRPLAAVSAALALGWTPQALAADALAYRGAVVLDSGATTQGNVPVSAANPLPVQGGVGSGSADAGAPVKVGCKIDTSFPTLASGQRSDWLCGVRGSGYVSLMDASSAVGASVQGPGDGQSNSIGGLWTNDRSLLFNGATWDRWLSGNALGAGGSSAGIAAVVAAPTSSQGQSIAPVTSAAAESSHVIKASAGNLYRVAITTGASGGYLMVFDAATAPADGTVTPKICRAVGANASLDVIYDYPERYATGVTVVFSTTGCFTKTASATAHVEALAL